MTTPTPPTTDARARLLKTLGLTPDVLAAYTDDQVSTLYASVAQTLRWRNGRTVKLLVNLYPNIGPQLASTVAEYSLGPQITARMAEKLEAAEAVKVASYLSRPYVASLVEYMSIERLQDLAQQIPLDMVIDVGQRLLDLGYYETLAACIPLFSDSVVSQVTADATPEQMEQIDGYLAQQSQQPQQAQ